MDKITKQIIAETKIRIATLKSLKEALQEHNALTPIVEAVIDGKIDGNTVFIEGLENAETFKVY